MPPMPSNRQSYVLSGDTNYVLHVTGPRSVYQFCLSKRWAAWVLVLVSVACQLVLLSCFAQKARVDWTPDDDALVYARKCQPGCAAAISVDGYGWFAFTILMMVHLLKDVINGIKTTVFSVERRHAWDQKARLFVAGLLMNSAALFVLYVTTMVYNLTATTSNAQIIGSSVVILFVSNVDQYLYGILTIVHQGCAERLTEDNEWEGSVRDRQERLMRDENGQGPVLDAATHLLLRQYWYTKQGLAMRRT